MEKKRNPDDKQNSIDSPNNNKDANKGAKSLTNDESSEADPNEVEDKASFTDNDKKKPGEIGRYDGNIGI